MVVWAVTTAIFPLQLRTHQSQSAYYITQGVHMQ